MVDERRSRRIFKQVNHSVLLTDLSHDLHACGNVLMHIDMFSGMYTSLGSGGILVRMCGTTIFVDNRENGVNSRLEIPRNLIFCLKKYYKPTSTERYFVRPNS